VYANNLTCSLTIVAPHASTRLRLTFNTFTTLGDVMTIYDGPTTSSSLLLSKSGTQFSFTVDSGGQFITVRFVTDATINNPGCVCNSATQTF
jgi:hypothetical protein